MIFILFRIKLIASFEYKLKCETYFYGIICAGFIGYDQIFVYLITVTVTGTVTISMGKPIMQPEKERWSKEFAGEIGIQSN